MSFSEVKKLRQAGNLEDAFAMAYSDLKVDPENIWGKRGMCWVYFDQLKLLAQAEQFEPIEQILNDISTLGLPAEEDMFWTQTCWQVGKIAFALQKAEHVEVAKLDRLFSLISTMPLPKPSEAYSFVLKAFQKSNKLWAHYTDFVEWWGIEHLMPKDYLPEEMQDGKKGMAFAEQVAIAYARRLAESPVNREKIEAFMPVLDTLAREHPEYQYPPYYKGKLLLAIGDKENVFSAFLPFARKKQSEFWVWELLAETFEESDARFAACLCRALLCRAEPKFLGKVRTKMADWLIANQQLPEAKTEIEAIAKVYQAEGWKMNLTVQKRTQEPWYQQTNALLDNQALYKKFQGLAEEILFGDMQEELVVVDFVNREKDILYFVGEAGKHGGLKYGKRLRNVRIGDLILVRFSEESRDGMYRAFTLQNAPKETVSELKRTFEGTLSIRSGQPFGFADKVFVEPEMVQKSKLTDGQSIKGECILSWNKKRTTMTWKAIVILSL